MNPVKAFIDEGCVTGSEDLIVKVTDLRVAYDDWVDVSGVEIRLSTREFNAYLRESGYRDKPTKISKKVAKCWHGIGLRDDTVDDEELI